MGYHHKKAGILTCTLLASVVLASCSFAPSGTGPEGKKNIYSVCAGA